MAGLVGTRRANPGAVPLPAVLRGRRPASGRGSVSRAAGGRGSVLPQGEGKAAA